jgi:hypothetical protein
MKLTRIPATLALAALALGDLGCCCCRRKPEPVCVQPAPVCTPVCTPTCTPACPPGGMMAPGAMMSAPMTTGPTFAAPAY